MHPHNPLVVFDIHSTKFLKTQKQNLERHNTDSGIKSVSHATDRSLSGVLARLARLSKSYRT